jgi:hypothetical protein
MKEKEEESTDDGSVCCSEVQSNSTHLRCSVEKKNEKKHFQKGKRRLNMIKYNRKQEYEASELNVLIICCRSFKLFFNGKKKKKQNENGPKEMELVRWCHPNART